MERIEKIRQIKPGEKELPISSLLQAAFDSSDMVRFIVDEDGTVLHFNRKAYENSILIHQRELKKGENLFDYAGDTTNRVQSHLKSQLAKTFTGETFVSENEVKFKLKSRWFQTEYVPILHNKKIVAASILTFDITERKIAELQTAQLVAELKTSTQTRLQQIEYSLDSMSNREKDMTAEAKELSAKLYSVCPKTMCLDGKLQFRGMSKKMIVRFTGVNERSFFLT